METNEIMTNDEVFETTVEVVCDNSGRALKIALGAGIAVVVGVMAYKYIAKPLLAEYKAKKEKRQMNAAGGEYIKCDSASADVEPEDEK